MAIPASVNMQSSHPSTSRSAEASGMGTATETSLMIALDRSSEEHQILLRHSYVFNVGLGNSRRRDLFPGNIIFWDWVHEQGHFRKWVEDLNERPIILRQVQQKWQDANGRFFKYQSTKHDGRLVAESLLPLSDKYIQNELHKRFITTKSNMSQPRKKQGKSVWNSRFSKYSKNTSSNNSESSNEAPTFRLTESHSSNKAPWLQNITPTPVSQNTAGIQGGGSIYRHDSITSAMCPPFSLDTIPPFVTHASEVMMTSNPNGGNKLFTELGMGAKKRKRTTRAVSDDSSTTAKAEERLSEVDELKRLVNELRRQAEQKDAKIEQLTALMGSNPTTTVDV